MTASPKNVYIVKISFGCNMRCLYCLEGDKSGGETMSENTLHALISKAGNQALSTDGLAVFVWHGGEPLLPGLGFYQKVVAEQKAFGSSFKCLNLIQTNGVLLNDAFANFFVDHNFGVGVSLDGPPSIHDAQRRNAISGTFKESYAGLLRMRERGMRTGALAVCTRNTLDHLDEFYDFFRDRSIDVNLRPLTFEGRATSAEAAHLQISPKEYGDALVTLYDQWKRESDRFTIDPLRTYVRALETGSVSRCGHLGQCPNYLDVLPGGELYLCGKSPDARNELGNINTTDLGEVHKSPKREEYVQIRKAMREVCAAGCDYVAICNGGCTRNSYLTSADALPQDHWCESYQRIFNHIKRDLILPKCL
jgi:uncharacterized protein